MKNKIKYVVVAAQVYDYNINDIKYISTHNTQEEAQCRAQEIRDSIEEHCKQIRKWCQLSQEYLFNWVDKNFPRMFVIDQRNRDTLYPLSEAKIRVLSNTKYYCNPNQDAEAFIRRILDGIDLEKAVTIKTNSKYRAPKIPHEYPKKPFDYDYDYIFCVIEIPDNE